MADVRHELEHLHPRPSGWHAVCACGVECRGPRQGDAIEAWHDHVVAMTGGRRPVPGRDDGDRLIAAWLHWEDRPASRGACLEVRDAIRALGLSPTVTHERVADARRRGLSVPDAVMTVINAATEAV